MLIKAISQALTQKGLTRYKLSKATDGTTATQQWRSAITAAMRNEGKTAYGYAKDNGIAPAALIN